MGDHFTCSGPDAHHVESYTGQDGTLTSGQSWYRCEAHPETMTKRDDHPGMPVPMCAFEWCGAPESDHPPLTLRMNAVACGVFAEDHAGLDHAYRSGEQVTPKNPRAGGPCAWTPVEGYAVPSHGYENDGAHDGCTHSVALAKVVGFLCPVCGAPLVGMPEKEPAASIDG